MGLHSKGSPLCAHDNAVVMHVGKFEGAGDSTDPTNYVMRGVTDFASSATGVHTFTLPGKGGVRVLSANASCSLGNTFCTVSVNEATRVVTVKTFDELGVAQALSATNFCYIAILVKNSSTRS